MDEDRHAVARARPIETLRKAMAGDFGAIKELARILCEANGDDPDVKVFVKEPRRTRHGALIAGPTMPAWEKWWSVACGLLAKEMAP